MQFFGEFIALFVAISWTFTALFFEYASNKVGSLPVNLIRLLIGFVLLGVFLLIATGSFLPVGADSKTWMWMLLSGVVGFVFGDFCLFYSYTVMSARFSQLFMTLAPPFAALFGWILLDETLSINALLGMLVTLSGIAISVLKRGGANNVVTDDSHSKGERKNAALKVSIPLIGVLLGIGAALGQGLGIVLSKVGMGYYELSPEVVPENAKFIPFAATQIRVIAGIAGFTILIIISGRVKSVIKAFKDRKGLAAISGGAFFGPFLGVSLSLTAVQHTNAAVASTIMATTPILILVPYTLFYKKKVTKAEVLGAILSVCGVIMFFL